MRLSHWRNSHNCNIPLTCCLNSHEHFFRQLTTPGQIRSLCEVAEGKRNWRISSVRKHVFNYHKTISIHIYIHSPVSISSRDKHLHKSLSFRRLVPRSYQMMKNKIRESKIHIERGRNIVRQRVSALVNMYVKTPHQRQFQITLIKRILFVILNSFVLVPFPCVSLCTRYNHHPILVNNEQLKINKQLECTRARGTSGAKYTAIIIDFIAFYCPYVPIRAHCLWLARVFFSLPAIRCMYFAFGCSFFAIQLEMTSFAFNVECSTFWDIAR